MIFAERIVPGLNRFYSGHFQNTPNIKAFFGYAAGNNPGVLKNSTEHAEPLFIVFKQFSRPVYK